MTVSHAPILTVPRRRQRDFDDAADALDKYRSVLITARGDAAALANARSGLARRWRRDEKQSDEES